MRHIADSIPLVEKRVGLGLQWKLPAEIEPSTTCTNCKTGKTGHGPARPGARRAERAFEFLIAE